MLAPMLAGASAPPVAGSVCCGGRLCALACAEAGSGWLGAALGLACAGWLGARPRVCASSASVSFRVRPCGSDGGGLVAAGSTIVGVLWTAGSTILGVLGVALAGEGVSPPPARAAARAAVAIWSFSRAVSFFVSVPLADRAAGLAGLCIGELAGAALGTGGLRGEAGGGD